MIINSFDGEYKYLSNFWGGPVTYNNLTYNTVEAAFQAQKTLNQNIRIKFTQLTAPEAKKQGCDRNIVILRPDWEQVKDGIMEDLCRIKFNIPKYKNMLLDTKDAELIEGNWWNDTYWGVCNGIGKNKLGNILMKIRQNLK